MNVYSEERLREKYGAERVQAFDRRAAERRAKGETLSESDILEAMQAEGNDDANGEDEYDLVIGMLTEVARKAAKIGIGLEDYVPALIDYTAAVALAIGGEEALQAFITRMQNRIEDWRARTFPFNGHIENKVPARR